MRGEIVGAQKDFCHHISDKKIYRPKFAQLMSRVFSIDVLECPRCKSRMQLISIVQNQHATRDILRSLKMSTAPPSDLCGPKDHVVEYDDGEVRYKDEEEPPIPDF